MTPTVTVPGTIVRHLRRVLQSEAGFAMQHLAMVMTEFVDLTEEQYRSALAPSERVRALFERVGFASSGVPEGDFALDLGSDVQLVCEALKCRHRAEIDQLKELGSTPTVDPGEIRELGEFVDAIEAHISPERSQARVGESGCMTRGHLEPAALVQHHSRSPR